MKRPLVSVCIANYNGESMLADCLDSVYAQRGEFDLEVLVHDDASADASLRVLGERYPQAIVIASATNVGFCIANNRMVERARGDYVLLLNNDAALLEDAIATMVRDAMRHPGPAITTLAQYDWETGTLVDRGRLVDFNYVPVPNTSESSRDLAYVIGACLFTSRQFWQSLGGFPPWMDSIGEDLHLCCLARLRGARVACLEDSGYRHRQGASYGGNRPVDGVLRSTYRRRLLSEKNRVITLIECTPTPLAFLLLSIHLMILVLEGVLISLRSRSTGPLRKIYLPAVLVPIREFPAILRRRAGIQRSRRIGTRAYFKGFVWRPRKLELLLKFGWPSIR